MGRKKKKKSENQQSRESKRRESGAVHPTHPFDPVFVTLLRDIKVDETTLGEATYVVARAIDQHFTLLARLPLVMRLDGQSTLTVMAQNERIYFAAFPKDVPIALGSLRHGSHERAWFVEHSKVVTDELTLRSWLDWLKNANGGTLG